MSDQQKQSATIVEVITLDQFARILKAECRVQELEEALQASTELLQEMCKTNDIYWVPPMQKQIAANEAALGKVREDNG